MCLSDIENYLYNISEDCFNLTKSAKGLVCCAETTKDKSIKDKQIKNKQIENKQMEISVKKERTEKHRLNVADIITLIRMMGTMALVFLRPLSTAFLGVYALTGLTDVLDGWIARKTKTASDFGARLDSMADLLFYAVMLFRIFPILWNTLPGVIWYAVAVILILRITAYLTAMVKYRKFASLHTYLNKLTGGMLFLVPFVLFTEYAVTYCWIICVIAVLAAIEELIIHLQRRTCHSNTKSIFQREC